MSTKIYWQKKLNLEEEKNKQKKELQTNHVCTSTKINMPSSSAKDVRNFTLLLLLPAQIIEHVIKKALHSIIWAAFYLLTMKYLFQVELFFMLTLWKRRVAVLTPQSSSYGPPGTKVCRAPRQLSLFARLCFPLK